MPASFVLSRVSRCGVAQGYAALAPLPAALLDGHFEHPALLASITIKTAFRTRSGRCRFFALSNDYPMSMEGAS
jgi:hypothetical protein